MVLPVCRVPININWIFECFASQQHGQLRGVVRSVPDRVIRAHDEDVEVSSCPRAYGGSGGEGELPAEDELLGGVSGGGGAPFYSIKTNSLGFFPQLSAPRRQRRALIFVSAGMNPLTRTN
jgi:hypothetical protein